MAEILAGTGIDGGMLLGIVGQIIFFALLFLFIAAWLIIFGGLDRYLKKVPLFARPNRKIEVYDTDADSIRVSDFYGREYGVIVWEDKATQAYKMYVPKLRSPVYILPAHVLTQVIMKFVRVGEQLIPVGDIKFRLAATDSAEIETIKDIPESGERIDAEHHYIIDIVLPEVQRIIEDTQLSLGITAELLRPKVQALERMLFYGSIIMVIFLVIIALWFSFGQAERATNTVPAVVDAATKGAGNICRDILANFTQRL